MTCEYAKQQGLYVLGDVKRGDIGSTAAAYAHHLSGIGLDDTAYDPWHEDAVTVNPYLGTDGITPFVDAATANDKDIFVLVRTSNPSSSELQELELASGERVYEHVADLVEGWGAETIGKNGYSRVGAVVGATHPEEGKALRARMPHTFFLVPGTALKAAPRKVWPACSTVTAWVRLSTRHVALSVHGKSPASILNP